MEKLITTYEKVLTSLGLHLEEGFIFTTADDTRALVHDHGASIVLPTKEHLKTLVNEKTKKIDKIPFNPLIEDYIAKTDSASLIKVKRAIETRLTHSLVHAGGLLLEVASDVKHVKNIKFEVSKFITSLGEAVGNKKVEKEVDVESYKKWSKIYANHVEKDGVPILKLLTKKSGEIKKDKYNKVTTIHSPLLDELKKWKKGDKINGVTLRPKDADVFKTLIRYILKELDDDDVLRCGSNDTRCPGFISAFQLYLVVGARINKIIAGLDKVNVMMYDEAKLNLQMSAKDLDFSEELVFAKTIPSEKSLQLQILEEEEKEDEDVSLGFINRNNRGSHNVSEKKEEDSGEVSMLDSLNARYGDARDKGSVTSKYGSGRDDRDRYEDPRDRGYGRDDRDYDRRDDRDIGRRDSYYDDSPRYSKRGFSDNRDNDDRDRYEDPRDRGISNLEKYKQKQRRSEGFSRSSRVINRGASGSYKY